ncbi:MAG: bacteriorhodopsin-like [Planctomycetota bacterium]|nr:bacteriorhodopsin-like [Planctomycetota bacterium]
MPDLSLFEYDLVANMMSFCIAVMGAGALFLFLSRANVAPRYRPALLVSALVPAIACYHYIRIGASWASAYVLQNGAYTASGIPFNDAYRYADWLITVPLLIIELIAVCALTKTIARSMAIKLSAAAALMILLGYPGEVASSAGTAWLWWGLAMIPFVYILVQLYGSFAKATADQPATVKPLISKARGLILITWSFYPIAFLAPYLGLSGAAGETALQVGYTVADITAKVGLGLYIYFIARAKSEADGWSAQVEDAAVTGKREMAGV